MKQIVLCPNPYRDTDFSLTVKIKELLNSCGIEPLISPFFEDDLHIKSPNGLHFTPLVKAVETAELMICFGGDGTILHAAKASAKYGVPILGINLGNKGFMAELEVSQIEKIKEVLENRYQIDRRMMVDVSIQRDGSAVYSDYALNEAVIGSMSRMIDISVYADNSRISGFSGDGIIISTPTGSTAYSMSAGGPIVEPAAENIIITPICAYKLMARSFVLAPNRTAMVELGRLGSRSAYLSVDGGKSIELQSGDLIQVEKSKYYTDLVRILNKNFYDIMNEKLGEEKR